MVCCVVWPLDRSVMRMSLAKRLGMLFLVVPMGNCRA